MKTLVNSRLVLFAMLAFFSCSKENIQRPVTNETPADNLYNKPAGGFFIGQSYGGGIIFYIDNSGQHGLITATADQGTGISWRNGSNVVTDATGTAVGDGKSNTNKIVNAQGKTGTYAAYLCYKYKNDGFKDWYLPSKDELDLLYDQRNVVGGFGATDYWSSSESSKGKAWEQEFGGGFQFKYNKSFTLNVRAIRSF